MEDIKVDCYCGHRGEETPRRFYLGRRCIEAVIVTDRWLSPDHRYFKVLGDDGGEYILRHDPHNDLWQLTFFRQKS